MLVFALEGIVGLSVDLQLVEKCGIKILDMIGFIRSYVFRSKEISFHGK